MEDLGGVPTEHLQRLLRAGGHVIDAHVLVLTARGNHVSETAPAARGSVRRMRVLVTEDLKTCTVLTSNTRFCFESLMNLD